MKHVVGLACRECGRGHALSAQAACDDCFGPLESCTTTTRSRLTYRPTSSREAAEHLALRDAPAGADHCGLASRRYVGVSLSVTS